jgi:outer membrane lipoprotein-sorting protein
MNCAEIKELFVAFVEGVLEESQKQAVAEHLKDCAACQTELKELTTLHDRLVKNGKVLAQSDLENKVLERIIREQNVRLKTTRKTGTGLRIRRIIMKSRITKLAAAAGIVVAVFVALHFIGNPFEAAVTFAEVVQPFLTARTATFKVTVSLQGGPTQTGEGMFMEPGRVRQTSAEGATIINDLQQGKMVVLIPAQNRAIVYELVNIPEDPGDLNIFVEIRRRVLEAQQLDEECVQFLGEQEIEGRTAIGYHVQKAGLDITVWADAETLLPIRMENTTGPTTYVMSDIVFDVELDESLFSLEIPEGYTVHTLQMDGSEPEEKDLIEMFRIWAEHMDGSLPSALDMSAPMEFVNAQRKKMMEQGQKPSEEEMMEKVMGMQQTIMKMSRGGTFVQQLPADSDWHYVGKDAKFGDADTAIFWYRPEDSETYRVIYGDLTVKDVMPENLPK